MEKGETCIAVPVFETGDVQPPAPHGSQCLRWVISDDYSTPLSRPNLEAKPTLSAETDVGRWRLIRPAEFEVVILGPEPRRAAKPNHEV